MAAASSGFGSHVEAWAPQRPDAATRLRSAHARLERESERLALEGGAEATIARVRAASFQALALVALCAEDEGLTPEEGSTVDFEAQMYTYFERDICKLEGRRDGGPPTPEDKMFPEQLAVCLPVWQRSLQA